MGLLYHTIEEMIRDRFNQPYVLIHPSIFLLSVYIYSDSVIDIYKTIEEGKIQYRVYNNKLRVVTYHTINIGDPHWDIELISAVESAINDSIIYLKGFDCEILKTGSESN